MPSEIEARVDFRASVSPSEDPEKVVGAVSYLAGGAGARFDRDEKRVRATFDGIACLEFLRNQLRDRRIRSAARRLLLKGMERRRTTLMLNRQAAAVGVVALCSAPEESPLGPVYLVISADKLQEAIDWLAEAQPG